MPQPHAAHARGRDALSQFIGHPHLAKRRLLDRQRHNGILDLLRHSVLQNRLLAADLLQCQLTSCVIQFLEAVEAVAAIRKITPERLECRQVIGGGPESF
jgi:hypothetical protein